MKGYNIREQEFLFKYRGRLEAKLEQVRAQIERTRRLLESPAPDETPGFVVSLRQAWNDRRSIAVELDDLQQILQGRTTTQ